ncbi:MAG: class I SAM-dependent methyltransferase [Crocinitomicaceae bacterium]|nr:class I SAM-dependent methyltransferase [Crocinitomicaceae bacterium]
MKFESNLWEDYELIDVGGGQKYERFGSVYTIRPESLAYFKSNLNQTNWLKECDFVFEETDSTSGKWIKNADPKEWEIHFDDFKFQLRITKFKHIGLFPEQEINWRFIKQNLKAEGRFLNLFGYTGAASIVAAGVGAKVVHVDSVKQIVQWASENAKLNQLDSISWVVEDALKFARKELKRDRKYNGIIMDPPAFGFGAKGEKWKIEDNIEELTQLGIDLLEPGGFLIINTYSPKLPLKKLKQILDPHKHKGSFEVGELTTTSTSGKSLTRGNLVRFIRN